MLLGGELGCATVAIRVVVRDGDFLVSLDASCAGLVARLAKNGAHNSCEAEMVFVRDDTLLESRVVWLYRLKLSGAVRFAESCVWADCGW